MSRVNAYLECLLWTSTLSTEDGEPVEIEGDKYRDGTPLDQIPGCDSSDVKTLCPKLLKEATEDLEGFASYCEETLGFDPFEAFDEDQVAHDFCLSRNGHGAGFFDGTYEVDGEERANDLQKAAKTFGTHGVMVWVDESGTLRMDSHS
jgi:hypothetical protein